MTDSLDPARAYLPPAALRSAYADAIDPIPFGDFETFMPAVNTMSQHSFGKMSGLGSSLGAPESLYQSPSPSERPGKEDSPGSYSSRSPSGHSGHSAKRHSPKDGKRKKPGRARPRQRAHRKKGDRKKAEKHPDEADTTSKGSEEEHKQQSIRSGSPGPELPSLASGTFSGSGIFFTPFDEQRDDGFPPGLSDLCSVHTMEKEEDDEDEDEGLFNLSESRYLKDNVGTQFALGLAEIMNTKPSDPIQYLGHFLYRWNYNQEARLADKRKFDKIRRQCERDALKKDVKF